MQRDPAFSIRSDGWSKGNKLLGCGYFLAQGFSRRYSIFDVQLRIWMCHISYMMMYKLQTLSVLAFS